MTMPKKNARPETATATAARVRCASVIRTAMSATRIATEQGDRGFGRKRFRKARMRTRRGTPRLCQRCDARPPPSRRTCPRGSSRTRKGSNRTGGPVESIADVASRPSHTAQAERARPPPRPPCGWPRLSANRPPHDDAEVDERDLEDDEHEDGFPHGVGHVAEQSNATMVGRDRLGPAFLTQASHWSR